MENHVPAYVTMRVILYILTSLKRNNIIRTHWRRHKGSEGGATGSPETLAQCALSILTLAVAQYRHPWISTGVMSGRCPVEYYKTVSESTVSPFCF